MEDNTSTSCVYSLAGLLFCSIYAYVYIDHLPASVRKHLDTFVPTDLNHPKPLSKLLAYVVDGYFSTNPYSKTLALLVLTVYIIVIGSLAIYVVTGDSLYAAFWQVRARDLSTNQAQSAQQAVGHPTTEKMRRASVRSAARSCMKELCRP